MPSRDELGTAPIGRLVVGMSVPSILGVMAYNLYNLLDMLLLSRGAGIDAVGGVAASFPLFVMLSAVATTLGSGAASLMSRAFGRDDEAATRIAANTFLAFYAVAIAVTVLGLVFLDPMLGAMGVTDTLLPQARGYTRIILIGAVTGTGFSNLIRAEGASRYAMAIWVIPLSVNIALDALFVFGLSMGAVGAALGTVLGQCVSMAMSVNFFVVSGRSRLRLRPRHFRPSPAVIGSILAIGAPTLLQLCGQSLAVIAVNRMLAGFGADSTPSAYGGDADLAIGAYGLAARLNALLLFPVTGLAQGIQPIIGFNHGARKPERVRGTVRLAMLIAAVYGVAASLLAWRADPLLLRLMTPDDATVRYGAAVLAIMSAGSACTGVAQIQATCAQAVGRRLAATVLSLLGQVIVFIPTATALAARFGPAGIW